MSDSLSPGQPCPHCWPPEAQALAALQAERAAHEVNAARVARERAALLARLLGEATDAEMATQNREKV